MTTYTGNISYEDLNAFITVCGEKDPSLKIQTKITGGCVQIILSSDETIDANHLNNVFKKTLFEKVHWKEHS